MKTTVQFCLKSCINLLHYYTVRRTLTQWGKTVSLRLARQVSSIPIKSDGNVQQKQWNILQLTRIRCYGIVVFLYSMTLTRPIFPFDTKPLITRPRSK